MSNEIITFIIVGGGFIIGFYGLILMLKNDKKYSDLINKIEQDLERLYKEKKELETKLKKEKQNEQ